MPMPSSGFPAPGLCYPEAGSSGCPKANCLAGEGGQWSPLWAFDLLPCHSQMGQPCSRTARSSLQATPECSKVPVKSVQFPRVAEQKHPMTHQQRLVLIVFHLLHDPTERILGGYYELQPVCAVPIARTCSGQKTKYDPGLAD